ncbi:MAG: penicillin-binding protein activator LpoB [Planctomycetota bacterium]
MKKLFVLPLLIATAACSSIGYDDPNRVETLTIDFGSTDLQTLAGEMVESLIQSPALNYIQHDYDDAGDQRIVTYMGGVENRTSEHIDTEGITDKMRVKLLGSGKFRFVAGDQGQSEVGDQVRFQQGTGRVDPAKAREFGKQIGADVILYGTLRSIDKEKGRTVEGGLYRKEDVYYQFVLNCVNIDTGELIWAEESELRKTARTGIFGG